MAAMPGPMPPKASDNTEEIMKGFHGIFKAMTKMESMNPGLAVKLAEAKKAMKDAVANVLKGDPSSLDSDSDAPAGPDASSPAPDAGAPPAAAPAGVPPQPTV